VTAKLLGASTDGDGFVNALRGQFDASPEGLHVVVLARGRGEGHRRRTGSPRRRVGGGARPNEVRVEELVARYKNVYDFSLTYRPVTSSSTPRRSPVELKRPPSCRVSGRTRSPSTSRTNRACPPGAHCTNARVCASANGLGMLAHQAALQLQWWWDVPIDAAQLVEGHFMTDTLSSMSSRIRSKDRLDLGLACGLIALGVTGVVMIYSATRQGLINAGYNPHYYLERQGFFVGIGIIVMYVVSLIDYRRLEILTTPFYVCSCWDWSVSISSSNGPRGTALVQPRHIAGTTERVHRADTHSRGGDVLSAKTGGLTMYDVVRLLVMAAVPLLLIVLHPTSAHRSSSS